MAATSRASAGGAGRVFAVTRSWDRLAWPVFGLVLLVAFVYLNLKGRGENFFYDEWSWILQRRTGLHAILASYNQHLLAAPIALYQLLFHTVGLSHYWVYRLALVCVHLGTAAAVFEFVRRRLGILAVLLALPIVFLGSAWEYVVWPVNVGFVASIGLSIAAMLLLDGDGRRRNILACGLLVLAVACSEFATVFALGIAIDSSLRDRSGRRVYVWLVPLVIYGAWWLGYHESAPIRQNITATPAYAAGLAANTAGGLFGLDIEWGRPLLIAGVVLLIVQLRAPGRMTPRLAGLLVAVCTFWTLVALGRASLGAVTSPRYIYPGAMLVVLIAAEALRGARLRPAMFGVATLVALFAVTANIRLLTSGADGLVVAARTVSGELTAVEESGGTLPPALLVDPHYAPVLAVGPYLAATAALHSSPADSLRHLMHEPENVRRAADAVLIRGGQVFATTTPRRCRPGDVRAAAAHRELTLPPSGLLVTAKPGSDVTIRARRFASGYEGAPLATLTKGQSILIRAKPDRSSLRWHVQIPTDQSVLVCGGR